MNQPLRAKLYAALLWLSVLPVCGQGTLVYTSHPVIQKGVKYQGAYSGSAAYSANDLVTYSGASYLALVGSTGQLPNVNGSIYWQSLGSASSGSSVTLKVGGVNTSNQSLLNLKAGSNIALSDDGSGAITFAVTGLAPSATTDTTNGNNITSGKLPQSQITGIGNTFTSLLERIANASIAQNANQFSDGSGPYFSAGPLYAGTGIYGDDAIALTATENPDTFSAPDILNIMSKFLAGVNNRNEFPSAVNAAGAPSSFCAAFDQRCSHAPVDGWITIAQGLKIYCDKVGNTSTACLSAYNTYVPALKLAWAAMPKNSTTHLPQVTAGDEWIAASLFMEEVRSTGEVANASVWYDLELKQMGALATAVGNSADAATFATERNLVDAGIQSDLIDTTSGMLKAGTIQNSTALDVQSSVLFSYQGLGTQAQRTAIANYINSNYSSLVNGAGFILNTPLSGGWPYYGGIPPNGQPPYVSLAALGYPSYNTTNYQFGYWSHDFLWFNATLASVNPLKARQQLALAASNPNINTEWYPTTGLVASGTNPNMESSQGMLAAARLLPPIPFNTTAGLVCVTTTTQGQCNPTPGVTVSADGLGGVNLGYVGAGTGIPAGSNVNKTFVDFQGGNGRVLAFGPNSATQPAVLLYSLSSDASKITVFGFGPAGVNLPAPVTMNSVSTGQSASTGTTCTVSGYITLTVDGTSRKLAYCQ